MAPKAKSPEPKHGTPLSDPKHEAFARFIVQGKTKREAAVLAGFSEKTAAAIGWRLFNRVNISKRVAELNDKVVERAVENAVQLIDIHITAQMKRVQALDYRWKKLQEVIEERAKDPSMAKVPGGKTGLILRQIKAIGSGSGMKVVPEYVIDSALLKEIRAHEEQAAKELGQWTPSKPVEEENTEKSMAPKITIAVLGGEETEAKPLNAEALISMGKYVPVQ